MDTPSRTLGGRAVIGDSFRLRNGLQEYLDLEGIQNLACRGEHE